MFVPPSSFSRRAGARKGASHSLPLSSSLSRVFPSDFGGSCRASPAVTAVTDGRTDDDDTSENVTSTSAAAAEVTCHCVVRSPRCYSMMCSSGFPVLRPSVDLIFRSGWRASMCCRFCEHSSVSLRKMRSVHATSPSRHRTLAFSRREK